MLSRLKERARSRSARQLVDMLVKHNPAASDAQIADVVSEWGELVEERPATKVSAAPAKGLGLGLRKRPKPA